MTNDPQEQQQMVGSYTVLEQLGRGGFGRVHAALDAKGSPVVLKFVPKVPGAERELLFAGVQGQNIIPILDTLETEQDYVLVMPRAQQSLSAALTASGGRLPESEAIQVLSDVVTALASIERAVVHRDLKPDNVLFWNDRWCLADFGIARYAEAATADVTFKLAGSLPYIAPERFRLQRATIKSDVYSLGVMAFEMLEGRLPFTDNFQAAHLHQEPPLMTMGSPGYQQLVLDCLSKAPEARPTPERLRARLSAIQSRSSRQPTALQQASLNAARNAAADETTASQQQSEAQRQQALFSAAATSLQRIVDELRLTIERDAPQAQVSTAGSLLEVRLGRGVLQVTRPTQVQSRKTMTKYGAMPFTVVAEATISAINNPPVHGYRGRQHSLWYADLEQEGEFRWYELGFHVMWGERSPFEPFALSSTQGDAVGALLPMMHTHQVARAPEAIDQGNHEAFVERWAEWLAAVTEGNLNAPSTLPERNSGVTWRR